MSEDPTTAAGRLDEYILDLLRQSDSATERTELRLQHAAAADSLSPESFPSGGQIGSYKLLSRVGEGGFGSVYLAEQIAPVRRRVALKVIKPGMDSRAVLARFEAERQALALMDHPNVARVFDAGTSPEGQPYFVMEYVAGVAITEHCDDRRLSVVERLALFAQVCAAVQHAHQKGVIHRDIKPSNVLVAYGDGEALPKVIDFGVAKALDRPLTERTLATEQGQVVGTPGYMSPEQEELTAQGIDTRSDIYSLGVVLYELLTGTRPFDPVMLGLGGAAHGNIQRLILDVEPPKPSTRLSSLGGRQQGNTPGPKQGDSRDAHLPGDGAVRDRPPAGVSGPSLAQISQKRRTDARTLVRQVRGELDWIVMKCLEKDRARRYDTASALALDIQRYLHQEPVLAGPPGAVYRLRKFVLRNRALVVGACLVAATLAAGVIGTSEGLFWALKERRRAGDEADRARLAQQAADASARQAEEQSNRAEREAEAARRERDKAEMIASIMEEMLSGVAPSVALGRDTEMRRDMMASAARRAARRGDWRRVIEASTLALEAEHPDVLGLGLLRVYGYLGTLQFNQAIASLEAMAREPDCAKNGEVMLLKALVVAGPSGSVWQLPAVPDKQAIQEARRAGLGPASDAIASAYLAETLPQTIESFELAVKRDPANPVANVVLIPCLLAAGRLASLEERLRWVAVLYPEDSSIQMAIAACQRFRGEEEEAQRTLDRLREKGEDELVRMAQVAFRTVELFDESAGFDPLKAIGIVIEARGATSAQLAHVRATKEYLGTRFSEGLRMPWTVVEPVRSLVEAIPFFTWQRYQDVLPILDKVAAINPHPIIYFFRGLSLFEVGRLEEAEIELSRLAQQTKWPWLRRYALFFLAQVQTALASQGDETMRGKIATTVYDLLNSGPLTAMDARDLAHAVDVANDLDLARRFVTNWERSDPSNATAAMMRAQVEYSAEAYGLALKAADRAIQLKPDHFEAYVARGWSLAKLLQWEEAERALVEARYFVETTAGTPQGKKDAKAVYEHLAKFYDAWGKLEEAEKYRALGLSTGQDSQDSNE